MMLISSLSGWVASAEFALLPSAVVSFSSSLMLEARSIIVVTAADRPSGGPDNTFSGAANIFEGIVMGTRSGEFLCASWNAWELFIVVSMAMMKSVFGAVVVLRRIVIIDVIIISMQQQLLLLRRCLALLNLCSRTVSNNS